MCPRPIVHAARSCHRRAAQPHRAGLGAGGEAGQGHAYIAEGRVLDGTAVGRLGGGEILDDRLQDPHACATQPQGQADAADHPAGRRPDAQRGERHGDEAPDHSDAGVAQGGHEEHSLDDGQCRRGDDTEPGRCVDAQRAVVAIQRAWRLIRREQCLHQQHRGVQAVPGA